MAVLEEIQDEAPSRDHPLQTIRCPAVTENQGNASFSLRHMESQDLAPSSHATRKQKKADIDPYTVKDEAEETSGAMTWTATGQGRTHPLVLGNRRFRQSTRDPGEGAFRSHSTKFVKIPWDVRQSCYFRTAHSAMNVPEPSSWHG